VGLLGGDETGGGSGGNLPLKRSEGDAKLPRMATVLFMVGFLLLVGFVCWLARGETNDHNQTDGSGGMGHWEP
jgi:hypothetical protein